MGQLHPLAVFLQRAVAGVQQKGGLDNLVSVPYGYASGPTEQGVHPGGELGGGEGLGNIVVRPGHQAAHLVHFLGAGGEHNDAHLGVARPDAAAYLKTVHLPGEHDVQQGYLHIRVLLDEGQGFFAGAGLDGVISRPLQVDDHKAADIGLVLQHQDLSCQIDHHFLNIRTFRTWSVGGWPTPR